MERWLEGMLSGTSGLLHLCSLPNKKDDGEPRTYASRSLRDLVKFANKWDAPGRGLFYCVSTIKKPRKKENCIESVFLHADLDVPVAEGEIKIKDALPPSAVVSSGRGMHCYWRLDKPELDGDRIEVLLKALSERLGSDPAVTHRAALMRLPGTHNTKDKAWLDVKVLRETSQTYPIEALENWLLEDNPFIRAGRNFKPGIDPAEELRKMGPGNIHTTQLRTTASLLNAGEDVDNVVQEVLSATRKAVGDVGWDWSREEKDIRGMCEDWLEKHPRGNVVNLAVARNKKSPKAKVHAVLGQGLLMSLRARGIHIALSHEQLWRYQNGLWSAMPAGEARHWLDAESEVGCREMGIESTAKLCSEVRAWIYRNPEVYQGHDIAWDSHGKILTRSGLLDPKTLTLEPVQPDHHATHRIECDYDPAATCPWWQKMLVDCLSDRDEADRYLSVIQEVFGLSLIDKKPRSLTRALVLVGPSNSGKSSLINTMANFLSDTINATPFDALENPHGLVKFLRPDPWVLHEAFDQSKWHFSAMVKSLLSGDAVNVNIKNGPMISVAFRSPVFWGTNTPPQFKEASKAMVNRMIIVPCTRVFTSDVGASEEAHRLGYASAAEMILDRERSGLLNWAVEGMRRAVARKQFLLPTEATEILHQVNVDSNLVAGFIEECIDYNEASMIRTSDFCAAFAMWWLENKGEDRHAPSNEAIGRALRALADPRITLHRNRESRFQGGIRLNETGLEYWEGLRFSNLATGKTARLSTKRSEVNQVRDSK